MVKKGALWKRRRLFDGWQDQRQGSIERFILPLDRGRRTQRAITRMLVMPYDTESESRNADFLWTSPFGLEGSGAFRRPGSIVRVLRTERWVRPTERAGSEGSFICRCLGQRKPLQPPCGRGNGLRWMASQWIRGSRCFPMNPVPLPAPEEALSSALALVPSFPLPGTSPQGETRNMRRKSSESDTSCTTLDCPPFGGECRKAYHVI